MNKVLLVMLKDSNLQCPCGVSSIAHSTGLEPVFYTAFRTYM